jgi:acyl-[acyl-carrier-protein]-phospholipid O-acyltransferase/long-chain-fatty-acid--[acyl-carrier-protein] ligase
MRAIWKFLIKIFLKTLYKMRFRMESLEEALESGERTLLAPHHASYIDPVLFGIFSPGSPVVVISPALARKKWFKWFSGCFEYVVVNLNDAAAFKQINDIWKTRSFVVLFPEIEPTTSGIMMECSETAAAAMSNSGAIIVPARAVNTQFTHFSRMGGRLQKRISPKVTLFCGEARKISVNSGSSKERRRAFALRLDSALMDMMAETIWDKKPIFDTLLEQRALWGPRHIVGMEPDGSVIDWNGFLTRIFIVSAIVEKISRAGERVGIMLPNSTMTLAAIIGSQRAGREPAMINYSMGSRSLLLACGVARVGRIVTSSRFVAEGKFTSLVEAFETAGIKITYIEDAVSDFSKAQMFFCFLRAIFARPAPNPEKAAADTALVLFTSGSEGTPKPVALSHLNIQANTAQVRSVLDFYSSDVMLAVMPMFHSFGLCTGAFMPLSTGMAVAFYPTPLHYKKIPQYARETKSSIILGTNSFLAGYAKNAGDFDFFEARYVICGGDKLKESTVKLWIEKFGVRILEGYGVTEASPVVGVNRIGHYKFGSIGKPLPCVRVSLAPVEGVKDAGRLLLRGPNIMKGYILRDGAILPPGENGYDTGDIVSIDDDGFMTIEGRAKRFAKIGGEMVSLSYIEDAVQEVWPDDAQAVVSIPEENKGEIIVLLTEHPYPDREYLRAKLIAKGLPELSIPKKVICVESIPKIGVGKIDYQSAVKLAIEHEPAKNDEEE